MQFTRLFTVLLGLGGLGAVLAVPGHYDPNLLYAAC